MKVVILCGGLGTRLSEETQLKPKPMVQIGSQPILWHIMNIYAHFGYNDFVLALGYKGEVIKEYFSNYSLLNSDFTVDLKTGEKVYHNRYQRDWRVTLIDTGEHTLTGGRLKRLKEHLRDEKTFMLTYGDGLANINIKELIKLHREQNKIATVCAVRPPARFGEMIIDDKKVAFFKEKKQIGEGWINGGFFVFENKIFEFIEDDQTILEQTPMEILVEKGELTAYRHNSFWQCMDTLRDKQFLTELLKSHDVPWMQF